jgi:hypothetical protein
MEACALPLKPRTCEMCGEGVGMHEWRDPNLSRANDCEMRACSSQTGSTLGASTMAD